MHNLQEFQSGVIYNWINCIKKLLNPQDIILVDGSENQTSGFKEEAIKKNILIKLNEDLLPNCYLHRSNPNDVARVESKTFICSDTKQDAGPTNNWWNPKEALSKLINISKNSYKNRIMYIIPFCMGQIESKFAKLGIEITDSLYVVLSMLTMAKVNKKVIKKLKELEEIHENSDEFGLSGTASWTRCIHASCNTDPDNRYICHFPQNNMIFSVNSNYGGNALLGKKCLALRLASVMGKNEGWLAEHMLIMGIQRPGTQGIKYICASFPSGCGKTNFAMMALPEIYTKNGYKIWCVGDDIAWLRIGKNGGLWAANPENGCFGVCADTDKITNPNALVTARENTIFTNVVHDKTRNTVWWTGLDAPPDDATDWQGLPWSAKNSQTRGEHPNSRFTAPITNCPCLSAEYNNPEGVQISAIIFGGKRSELMPLIFQTSDWIHGVFMGSALRSETTPATDGKTGILRNDPFSMLPFCGYNIADYFQHWLDMGRTLGEKAPKIFNINLFKRDKNNEFIWPGFGENIRILDWILDRLESKVDGKKSVIGLLPDINNINIQELNISKKNLESLLEIDEKLWNQELNNIQNYYNKLGENVPEELINQLEILKSKIKIN
ncbi:MAG: phosphoenolpyruvate carboxykinase (GTP) [Candidatus Improbicoccus devescovinae]|nr:MAG: phosphoenolpyruvate carboxykinase (GTP) [Candidatus Improbicoccus devescovinae]